MSGGEIFQYGALPSVSEKSVYVKFEDLKLQAGLA